MQYTASHEGVYKCLAAWQEMQQLRASAVLYIIVI